MVPWKIKRGFRRARDSVPTWLKTIGQAVRTGSSLSEVVDSQVIQTTTSLLTRLSINLKEVICIILKASKTSVIVTQTLFLEEMACKVRPELETGQEFHLSMVRMPPSQQLIKSKE